MNNNTSDMAKIEAALDVVQGDADYDEPDTRRDGVDGHEYVITYGRDRNLHYDGCDHPGHTTTRGADMDSDMAKIEAALEDTMAARSGEYVNVIVPSMVSAAYEIGRVHRMMGRPRPVGIRHQIDAVHNTPAGVLARIWLRGQAAVLDESDRGAFVAAYSALDADPDSSIVEDITTAYAEGWDHAAHVDYAVGRAVAICADSVGADVAVHHADDVNVIASITIDRATVVLTALRDDAEERGVWDVVVAEAGTVSHHTGTDDMVTALLRQLA